VTRHPQHQHLDGAMRYDQLPLSPVLFDPYMAERMRRYHEDLMARHERMAAIGDLACRVRRHERVLSALLDECPECREECWATCPDHLGLWQALTELQSALEAACDRG
jgi:hypothetical protein